MNANVSVIIPAYNAGRYIARALDSVCNQNCPVAEIIVVDDGSTDNTAELVQGYGKDIIFIRQENRGAAAARNTGVERAQSDYIAFLDADDVWSPKKIECQLKAFHQYPEASICWNLPVFTNEKELSGKQLENEPNIDDAARPRLVDYEEIFITPFLGTPNVMMRRDHFWAVGGFNTAYRKAEDIDLWLRACYGQQCLELPLQLTYVVRQENSLSVEGEDNIFACHESVINALLVKHPEFNITYRQAIKNAYSNLYQHWGSAVLVDGEYARAQRLLAQSLRYRLSSRSLYLFAKSSIKCLLG